MHEKCEVWRPLGYMCSNESVEVAPLLTWNMKNMVKKRANPYNRKTQSLFVAAVVYILTTCMYVCSVSYVWCAIVYYYTSDCRIFYVWPTVWMALTTWTQHCRTVPLPCVLRMFCFYIFIETDEMGHTTCHSNLPLIKFFFLLFCVLSVFL